MMSMGSEHYMNIYLSIKRDVEQLDNLAKWKFSFLSFSRDRIPDSYFIFPLQRSSPQFPAATLNMVSLINSQHSHILLVFFFL